MKTWSEGAPVVASTRKDASSIPGLTQWVKDPGCCGCGSDSTPGLGTSICHRSSRKKEKKKKEKTGQDVINCRAVAENVGTWPRPLRFESWLCPMRAWGKFLDLSAFPGWRRIK